MNKIVTFLLFLSVVFSSTAQAPESFKYQAVARDLSGQTVNNSTISLRLSILNNATSGSIVFQETQSVTTNDFGLFSISIGEGSLVAGSFSGIDWANGAKFLKVETDFTGGSAYTEMGTSQLLSVPYALYAKYAGTALLPNGTSTGNTSFWNGTEWVTNNSNIYNNGNFIGLGTNAPLQKLDIRGQVNISLDSSYMINNNSVLNTRGTNNLNVGFQAGMNTTIGFHNVHIGTFSGMANTIGSQNSFIGSETGVSNIDGMMNSFFGRRAGFLNTAGNENTFIGCYAGQNNSIGNHNSFFGVTTGNSNTTGEENTFLGAHAGYYNSTGNNNTFIGNFAGQFNSVGSNNVFIGFNAEGSSSNLTNAIVIGAGSVVNSSNSVVIGNSAITSIGGQVGWSTLSDKRLKENITDESLGIDFIKQLRPVRYNYSVEGQEGRIYSGLIAQDVSKILDELKIPFSGIVKPENENGYYSIRYAEFTIPLIKAVQEQQVQIDSLREQNEILSKELLLMKELEKRIEKLEKKQ
jgi:trimeric autotransporter adhesin